jgi:phosphate-selective porin
LTRGETDLWLGLRFQPRFDSFAGTLDEVDDLTAEADETLEFRRARIKGGGKVVSNWLSVYGEYDLKNSSWLDYRSTVTIDGWLDVRLGQWKSEFNRERINSSGRQQLVERSISTYWFTIDRQRGLSASARVGEGSRWDSRIWIQGLSGTGQNGDLDSDSGLLLTRLQWNPAGKELGLSGSDLARTPEPISAVAIAYVTGDTPYTRFSGSGGGQLPGFEGSDYELEQFLIESAVHYRGLGWEQELHFKKIRDERTGEVTRLAGGYAQLGSFLNEWWPAVPAAFELVGRFALIDPDLDLASDLQQEWTLGLNWFFNGHRNKLSMDVSWLDYEEPGARASETRVRLQWEVSI